MLASMHVHSFFDAETTKQQLLELTIIYSYCEGDHEWEQLHKHIEFSLIFVVDTSSGAHDIGIDTRVPKVNSAPCHQVFQIYRSQRASEDFA